MLDLHAYFAVLAEFIQMMIVFGMGGLLSMFLHRTKGMRFVIDRCIPVAAGLIVGDAHVNVVNAIVRMVQSVA